MVKVSVIVPVYGVEKYIERCAESLMQQTLDEVEYIFVDDGTKDNSINVLNGVVERYPQKNVRVIKHDVNKGLPSARNTGLSKARGEYIFHCDSDDYLEVSALEEMYNEAMEWDSDIVWCDFFEDYQNTQRYISQPGFDTAEDALKAMLTSQMRFNVWNKLCRRSLYEEYDVHFLDGNSMGEDMSMMKLFVHARTVRHISKALYHYVRTNPNALTKSQTHKRIEEDKNNIQSLTSYLTRYYKEQYSDYLGYHILWTKFPLLLTSGKQGQYEEWRKWSPEANRLISTLPDTSSRIKLLMSMASNNQWWFVKLHYLLIIKFYYSIRYSNTR